MGYFAGTNAVTSISTFARASTRPEMYSNVDGGKLRPSVSFHAAPIPAPAASYSLLLVRYQRQANDVLRTSAGLAEQLDDAFQRGADLPHHVGLIVTFFVAAGLAGEHDPFAGTVDHDAMGKAARFRPFGRLQHLHANILQNFGFRRAGTIGL
jgi:hypothetical protein